MSACRRYYPGRIDGIDSLITAPSTSAFPRLQLGRLLHYQFRGLLSVHSRYDLQTRQVALCDPLHRRLRRLCCLHRRSDCYRVERSSSRAGLSPAVVQRLSRRTVNVWLRKPSRLFSRPSFSFVDYFRVAGQPPRIDVKCGDHFLAVGKPHPLQLKQSTRHPPASLVGDIPRRTAE